MAGKDKHPPKAAYKPAFKTVKSPAAGTSVGAKVKVASGSKTVRPGSGNTTAAKTVPASLTTRQAHAKQRLDAKAAAVKASADDQAKRQAPFLKDLQKQKKTGVISNPDVLRVLKGRGVKAQYKT